MALLRTHHQYPQTDQLDFYYGTAGCLACLQRFMRFPYVSQSKPLTYFYFHIRCQNFFRKMLRHGLTGGMIADVREDRRAREFQRALFA